MNHFEALCRLAADEGWCWNLYCTECGHKEFRYAFSELASGKAPAEGTEWVVHSNNRRYVSVLGPIPEHYSAEQKNIILGICSEARLASIASDSGFPDWLGYLGLILEHMKERSPLYSKLSSVWAAQLMDFVGPGTPISNRLHEVAHSIGTLNIKDLERCESDILRQMNRRK